MMQHDAPSVRQKFLDNLHRVQDRIAGACARAGRDPTTIRLVAVTKNVDLDVIRLALEAGLTDLGENRVQQLARRTAALDEVLRSCPFLPTPSWHMIGHLQGNKVQSAVAQAQVIHSVDSLRLAESIDHHARTIGRAVDIFLQVNVSGENTKFGLDPGAIRNVCEKLVPCTGIRLVGLMTMAPWEDDPERTRPHFARLRELVRNLCESRLLPDSFHELSMGMSGDYEVAVEEGATTLRIGTALFHNLRNAPQ